MSGQALIEFALVMPIFLFAALGFIEAGFLVGTFAHQGRETDDVAEWAAGHPGESWNSMANALLPGCEVSVSTASDLTTATAVCHYQPRVFPTLFQGLRMTTEESAAIAKSSKPAPTPGPT